MKDAVPNAIDLPSFRGTRTGLETEDIKQSFLDNLFYGMGRVPAIATRNDLYTALALTVRDRLFRYGIRKVETHKEEQARRVVYLSAAKSPGPHHGSNLLNLDRKSVV